MIEKFKTFKIVIEYDGSCYHGWQRQKKEKTIQGEIEASLMIMTGQRVLVVGSGRTDAGVHAVGQVASFKLETNLSSEIFHRGLNSLLPCDIVIHSCEKVSNYFHARFDVSSKVYKYLILNRNTNSAINRKFIWYVKPFLNTEELKLAASCFLGKKDFKAFEGSGSQRKNTIRNIIKSHVRVCDNGIITYTVEGNGFLRFMVRNIVGTLVDVGLGRIRAEDIPELIESKDRKRVGRTAPPSGLFLIKVNY